MMKTAFTSLGVVAFMCVSFPGRAESTRVAREIHSGIVFPSLHRSAQENASGLLQNEAIAFHGEYGPPVLDADSHIGKLVGTLSFNNLALSLGYQAVMQSATTLQTFFTGGGFQYAKLSFGAGMSTPIDEGAFDPSLHAGFTYDLSPLKLALVFDRLDNGQFTQAILGAGFGFTHNLNFEVNVKAPPLAGFNDPGAKHHYKAGLAFYNKRVGLGGNGGLEVEKQSTNTNKKRGLIEVTAMFRILQNLATTFTYEYRRGHFIFGGLTLAVKLPELAE